MKTAAATQKSDAAPAKARTLRLAIIGCGHWGRNHLRVFSELPDVSVVAAADTQADPLTWVRSRYPGVRTLDDPLVLARAADVEAVVIATPASSHEAMAAPMLEAGKDVFVEKPLTTTAASARSLVALARRRKRVLMTDHTFLYNPAVRLLRRTVRQRSFGRIYYLTARRNHLGLIRSDVSVLWDLAAHDVSIFSYLIGSPPLRVRCIGPAFLNPRRADAAFLTLEYRDGIVGHVQVSWLDAVKVREVTVIGDRCRAEFNDLDSLEPVRVFKRGVSLEPYPDSFGEFKYLLRDGNIVSPSLQMREPLKEAAKEFLKSVRSRRAPLTDGKFGAEVVAVLEAADESMRADGRPKEVRLG